MTPLRVCLITPGHLASAPRVVKEAGALHATGFAVRVVAVDHYAAVRPLDEQILEHTPWRCDRIGLGAAPARLTRRMVQRLARRWLARGPSDSTRLAQWACSPFAPQLAEAAAQEPADLYIGHCLNGLVAAGLAAASRDAKLGFDAEDFHSAETDAIEHDPVQTAAVRTLEAHWLSRCDHFTAASPLIGEAYVAEYGIRPPAIVLNVFPLSDAPRQPPGPPPAGRPAQLYWFSQTIGAGRGLEELVAALAQLSAPCSLHLRGLPAAGFPAALRAQAAAQGFRGEMRFLPLGAPAEMARLAADSDLGLSLERRTPRNRDLCLTNKIFTYLLAGVPVALTPTRAQSALVPELGAAALPLDLADPAGAAATLAAFLADPARRAAARAASWSLGQQRYNWETEQRTLVEAVRAALGLAP